MCLSRSRASWCSHTQNGGDSALESTANALLRCQGRLINVMLKVWFGSWTPEATGILFLGSWHLVCSLARGSTTLVLRCPGFPVPQSATSRLYCCSTETHLRGRHGWQCVCIDKMHDINDRHFGAWLASCGFGACLAMTRRTSGSCACTSQPC